MADDPTPVTVTMPQVVEQQTTTGVRFLKRPGDPVHRDEPVLEIDFDKVTVELTAPTDGTLLTTRDDGDAAVGDPLYTLQPTPAPRAPEVHQCTLAWDATPLQARARAARRSDLAAVEAALLWLAVVRAVVATPAVFRHLVDASGAVALAHCDARPDGSRWTHAAIGPGDDLAAALASLRPPPTEPAALTIVRLHLDAPLIATPTPVYGLTLIVGPPLAQPVVVAGAVVIRPIATLSASFRPGLPADDAARLGAALAEQLAAP